MSIKEETKTEIKETKKRPAKKNQLNATSFVEFQGNSLSINDALNKCINHYKAQEENAGKEINDVKIYIKPEDNKIYYVVNDCEADAVALF